MMRRTETKLAIVHNITSASYSGQQYWGCSDCYVESALGSCSTGIETRPVKRGKETIIYHSGKCKKNSYI